MEAGKYIGTLLQAVTQAHELHLQQKGAGAYSRHMALGALYEGLQESADTLAECYQGLNGIIRDYPEAARLAGDDAKAFTENLGMFVEENRAAIGDASFLQNIVDEIQAIVVRTIYKLENFA